MRTLIIQHDDDSGPGVMHEPLAAASAIALWHTEREPHRPDLDGVGALLVLGGNANPDEDYHPWLAPELDLIEEALDVGVPILGICLGGQLLARVAGGRVGPAVKPELAAWRDVGVLAEAADDVLLGALPRPFFGFEWHKYGFEAPPGATLLAANDAGQQAFRVQNRAWGLQFHLEINAATVNDWAISGAAMVEENGGAERLAKSTATFLGTSMATARAVANRFALAAQVACGELPPEALATLEYRPPI